MWKQARVRGGISSTRRRTRCDRAQLLVNFQTKNKAKPVPWVSPRKRLKNRPPCPTFPRPSTATVETTTAICQVCVRRSCLRFQFCIPAAGLRNFSAFIQPFVFEFLWWCCVWASAYLSAECQRGPLILSNYPDTFPFSAEIHTVLEDLQLELIHMHSEHALKRLFDSVTSTEFQKTLSSDKFSCLKNLLWDVFHLWSHVAYFTWAKLIVHPWPSWLGSMRHRTGRTRSVPDLAMPEIWKTVLCCPASCSALIDGCEAEPSRECLQ